MNRDRRRVLGMAPLFLSSQVLGRAGQTAPSNRVRVGIIGTGGRGNLLIDQLPPGAQIVTASDCNMRRAEESAAKRKASWELHQDFRRLLDRKDIDGVIVATGDHQRVRVCITACQAGKDVYAEKPLTLYVTEGRALVKAVNRYSRVFQVGSQQRSMAMNQVACAFVRNGGLGKLHFVQGTNYTSSKPIPADLGEQPAPADLNWNEWLGQTPYRPYHEKLLRGWMGWRDYSGGEMTNWGAHGLDQIQCALGMDETGPVELWPLAGTSPNALAFRYANGVTVRLELPAGEINGGAIFVGEKGRIEITRNNFRTDPAGLIKEVPPKEEVDKWQRAQWQAQYHMQEWVHCMKTRAKPSAHVEIGHRSCSLAHILNITRQLDRRLQWDPASERFTNDSEAQSLLHRTPRKGFELPA